MNTIRYMTAKEVAELRRRTEGALAKERAAGEGPDWIKDNGRVLYLVESVEQHLADRTVHSSAK